MSENYKKQYILGGALTTSLMPILGFIPKFGLLIISIYTLPAFLIEKILRIKNILVVNQKEIIYPHITGLYVTVPFWIIIGALIGWLVFYNYGLRAKKKKTVIPPYCLKEVGQTIAWVIFFFMLFMAISTLVLS